MSIPSVPTDNLYKFIAFTGLVGVVTSVVLLISQLGKYVDEQVELNSAWVEAWIALDGADEARIVLTDARDDVLENDKADIFYEEIAALEGVADVSLPLVFDVQIKAIEFVSLEKVKTQAMAWTLGFGVVSLVVMCIGFGFWYGMLQRHLDAVAKQSAGITETAV